MKPQGIGFSFSFHHFTGEASGTQAPIMVSSRWRLLLPLIMYLVVAEEVPGLWNLGKSYMSLDTDGRVVRLDSFAKFLAPGFRLGWLTAPPHFVDKFTFHMHGTALGPCSTTQVNNYTNTDHMSNVNNMHYTDVIVTCRLCWDRHGGTLSVVGTGFPSGCCCYGVLGCCCYGAPGCCYYGVLGCCCCGVLGLQLLM